MVHCGRRLKRCLQTMIFVTAVATPGLAAAQVVHFLDCVFATPAAGTVTAWFGYFNPSPLPIPATAGTAENLFLPEPMLRTQPSSFLVGEVHYAFGVTFPMTETVSWWLFGIPLDVGLNSPSCFPPPGETCTIRTKSVRLRQRHGDLDATGAATAKCKRDESLLTGSGECSAGAGLTANGPEEDLRSWTAACAAPSADPPAAARATAVCCRD